MVNTMNTKIIRLNAKDMMQLLILPDKGEMETIWTIINDHGFVFDKFTLVIEPLAITFKVHIEGRGDDQIFHVKSIWKNRNGRTHNTVQDVTMSELFEKYYSLMESTIKNGYKAAKGNDAVDLLYPFHFMQYVVYSDLHRSVEHIEPARRTGAAASRSYKSNKSNECSLTDCIKIYHHKNHNQKYERKTTTWERRGGIRHLKSGKVVPYAASTCHARNIPENSTNAASKTYRL